MVKKWIVIAIIIVGLLVGCGLEYNFVNKSFNNSSSCNLVVSVV